ncbi:MAG: hydrogenase nickel incorporation protein HypA [Deltaproteobacteria bacterium]|nr:hydrogenase nickel incorporation protein HypA [Deltaproteobacteria bacterium]
MHELALAEAVLSAAREVAEREGLERVTKVAVRLGALQRISVPTFEFCVNEVRPGAGSKLAEADVQVEIEPVELACRPCGRHFGIEQANALEGDRAEAVHFIPELVHAFIACPDCASVDFEVVKGRGVLIASIEGEGGHGA